MSGNEFWFFLFQAQLERLLLFPGGLRRRGRSWERWVSSLPLMKWCCRADRGSLGVATDIFRPLPIYSLWEGKKSLKRGRKEAVAIKGDFCQSEANSQCDGIVFQWIRSYYGLGLQPQACLSRKYDLMSLEVVPVPCPFLTNSHFLSGTQLD